MPREKPLQGIPVRGNGDTSTLTENDYEGNIPLVAIRELENEATGLMHGLVMLTLHIKDGKLIRYTTSRERSFVPGKPTTGSGQCVRA